jgi:hypothetical protein
LSQVKIETAGLSNALGSSSEPTFTITAPGMPGARLTTWVPQVGQNSRVTGAARSLRANFFTSPAV